MASYRNLMEQHLEKGVLGLCVLLLMYSLVHWVFGSPREIAVASGRGGSTEMAAPDTTDAKLLEAAKLIQKTNDAAQEKDKVVAPQYAEEIARLRNQPLPETLTTRVDTAALQLPIEQELAPAEKLTLAALTGVIPPANQPVVWLGSELPKADKLADCVTAHVAAVYPVEKLKHAWDMKLQATTIPPSVAFYRVEGEVEEQMPDGSWGNRRPAKAVARRLVDAAGAEVAVPKIPDFDGKVKEQVDKTRAVATSLQNEAWVQFILQPPYDDILWPGIKKWDTWQIHLPRTAISDQTKHDTPTTPVTPAATPGVTTPPVISPVTPSVSPTTPPAVGPATPPVVGPATPPGVRPGPTTPPTVTPGRMPTTPPMPAGVPSTPPVVGPATPPAVRPPVGPTTPPAGATTPPVAPPVPTPHPTPTPTPTGAGTAAAAAAAAPKTLVLPEVVTVPAIRQQLDGGEVLAWLHDNSLDSSRTYRFRLRVVLVNPLLGYEGDVKDAADAHKVFLETPWSEWSKPCFVPRSTEFFVTGSSSSTGTLTVTVYRYTLGQWVKSGFNVLRGQAIGGVRKVKLVDPLDGKPIERDVDFSTNAIAVDVDFSRKIMKGISTVPTAEMLYLDETGSLQRRLSAVDSASARIKELENEMGDSKPITAAPPAGAGVGSP